MAYKTITHEGTVSDIGSAFGIMENLRDECQEIVDNAMGTNLEQTGRIQTLSDTCSTLDSACDEPPIPEIAKELKMTWCSYVNTDKRRGVSRARQRDEAVNILDAAIAACQDWIDNNTREGTEESRADVDDFVQELENVKSEWEGVEFPGMMG